MTVCPRLTVQAPPGAGYIEPLSILPCSDPGEYDILNSFIESRDAQRRLREKMIGKAAWEKKGESNGVW